jgi:hypothetical protein
MEYRDVFVSLAVVVVGIVGILGLMSDWNTAYSQNAGASFNQTLTHVQLLNNLTGISNDVAGNTQTEDGSGETDAQAGLIKQSLSTLKKIPVLLGLVPALYSDAASILGAPSWLVAVGRVVFLFVFAITFAYLLLLGAKRLL